FETPLAPMVKKGKTKLFLIPENHEGYSGFEGYFYYLDKQRSLHPKTQPQEGSYFCLQGDRIQLLGIDTIWHSRGRVAKARVKEWLEGRLEEGRQAGRANVLLTGYHPYEYGSDELNEILTEDLRDIARRNLIDLWFWGNTHYCALFDRAARTPFLGSCIGHGGYPYGLRKRSDDGDRPAPCPFFEDTPRFPAELGIRDDRGNNGYAVLTVSPKGDIGLEYIDWMGNRRYQRKLVRKNGESHLSLE
ncbi:MAG: metallophosphoesterase, partial [Vicinamibacteria bacterium]